MVTPKITHFALSPQTIHRCFAVHQLGNGSFVLFNVSGTETQGHELNEYASSCNIIVYDTPNVKDSELSTSDAPEGPVYAVLEGPGIAKTVRKALIQNQRISTQR